MRTVNCVMGEAVIVNSSAQESHARHVLLAVVHGTGEVERHGRRKY